jgi:hypothetical protein
VNAPARRGRRALKLGAAAALAGALTVGTAAAQSGNIAAVPERGLTFGPIIPGVPEVVSVRDAARRAEVVLVGEGSADVLLVLPRALVSRTGGTIPLSFGVDDGALVATPSGGLTPLDPLHATRVHLTGAAMRLLLGGTATPSREQPAGEYTTTIVVIISHAGT